MLCLNLIGLWCALLCTVLKAGEHILSAWYIITLLIIVAGLMLTTLFSIARQPRSVLEPNFTTPWTPWIPGLSILINVYLMFQLDVGTWIRFGGWIAVGLLIYFGYGIFHSHERQSVKNKLLLAESEAHSKEVNAKQT